MSEALTPTPEPVVEAPVIEGEATVVETPAVRPGDGSLLADAPSEASTETSTDTNTNPESPETEEPSGEDSVTDTALELKLPEGFVVDEPAMASFQEYAKTNGLSQDAAQAGLDLFTSQVQAQITKVIADQSAAWKAINDGWKAELETDPDFSGDAKLASLTRIGKLFDDPNFGDGGALREAFALTGAGNNPAIVRFLNNVAKVLDEGTVVPGGGPTGNKARTPGEILYGNSKGT